MPNKADLAHWETAFFRLFDWMDQDPDRRKAVFSPSTIDIYHVALYIDHQAISERMTHEEIRNITGSLIRIRNILSSVGWTQEVRHEA